MTTVDRDRWLKERIIFLEAQLDTDITDEQRAAIASELASLRKEAGGSSKWLRRLFGLPHLPR